MRHISAYNLIGIAFTLLIMFTAISIFTSLQLIFRIPITIPVGMVVGFLLPLVFVAKRELDLKSYLGSIIIFVICTIASGFVFDFSWDGQAYHELAQIMLDRGWNPYWSPEKIGVYQSDIWVHAYPKSLWIYSAGFYALTGNILMGKGYNLIVAIATFLLCYKVIHINFVRKRSLSVFFGLLITLNPVVCSQLTTYYVDGTLYLLMVDFLALCYLLIKNQVKQRMPALVTLSFIIIVACNIKFTGALYIVVLCLTVLALALSEKEKILSKKLAVIFLLSGIFGGVVVGYNPYVTNLVRHGSIGWPLTSTGKDKADIISHVVNNDFASKNRVAKFFIGYNSVTSNSSTEKPKLKIPGSVTRDELRAMAAQDVRTGGFGPWFSLILIFSLVGFVLLAYNRKLTRSMIILLVGLLCSVFANPECWFARYVPQLYLIPVLIAVWGMSSFVGRAKLLFRVSCILLLINLLFSVTYLPVSYWAGDRQLKELVRISKDAYNKSKAPLYVDFKTFYSKTASVMQLNDIPCVYFDSGKLALPKDYIKIYDANNTVIYAQR